MATRYDVLFRPLQIGPVTIKNRFCVGPLTLPSLFDGNGAFNDEALAYFEARARGGFGLIFTGALHPDHLVDPVHPLDSKWPLKAPKAFQRSAVALLERLDVYGTKMFPQLSLGLGRNAVGCLAPSPAPYAFAPDRTVPALTTDQIRRKIDQVVETAAFLKRCGFPGVEMHAMHWGYLLDALAMSMQNRRTDAYGGDLEGRLRAARELVEGIKAACGRDFVVSMRLSLKTYLKDYGKASLFGEDEAGRTLAEGVTIARHLESYGYDLLNVDFGTYDSFYYAAPPCYMEKGRILALAEEAKRAVQIPILCGGRMNDPDLAAQAIRDGKIDAVVLARPSLADPDYPRKVAMGRPETIRPCIGCDQGCIGALLAGRRVGCAVNAQAGREQSFGLSPAPERKRVAVVGGGVAGMEAARVAALRGHAVTLFEQSDRLGGHLLPAGAHTFKQELHELSDWYVRELDRLGIEIQLKSRISAAQLIDRAPDAVVLAVGSIPVTPPLPGVELAISCVDVLNGTAPVGQRVVVLGGGLVGCEVALGCAQEGKQVTVIEALPDILSSGAPVPVMNATMLRDLIDHEGVVLRTGCRVAAIRSDHVRTEAGEEIPADTVVLAVGFRARPSMAQELTAAGVEVYEIGDGAKVGNVMTAIDAAYTVARGL